MVEGDELGVRGRRRPDETDRLRAHAQVTGGALERHMEALCFLVLRGAARRCAPLASTAEIATPPWPMPGPIFSPILHYYLTAALCVAALQSTAGRAPNRSRRIFQLEQCIHQSDRVKVSKGVQANTLIDKHLIGAILNLDYYRKNVP